MIVIKKMLSAVVFSKNIRPVNPNKKRYEINEIYRRKRFVLFSPKPAFVLELRKRMNMRLFGV
jgi:hypothetical protein